MPLERSPLISFKGVHKAFGDNQVLLGVDLDIYPGETMVILGLSGSGKTVLTSMLVGLNTPDAGSISIEGTEISEFTSDADWHDLRLKMGYLFQGSALYDSMTVGENVAFPMIQHLDLNTEEIEARVAAKLKNVGLTGVEHLEPAALSGGMQRRAALARSLALDPQIVIYDEPTSGLDPITGDGIGQLILSLQESLKVTSVVVTHDLRLTEMVADRLAFLHQGKWAFEGTFEDFSRSSHPEVARFLRRETKRETAA